MRLAIIVTGGTFDKEYNERTGELFFRSTHVGEMLKLGRCSLPVRVKTLLMIDSLRMKASHRSAILRECARAPEPRIVVTHGTDTMVETAKVLGRSRERALEGKTIVLTGAMVPYRFGSSDGMFNLGSAISFAQSLPPGVFIAMNGRCFPWSSVRKNREKGLFEAE